MATENKPSHLIGDDKDQQCYKYVIKSTGEAFGINTRKIKHSYPRKACSGESVVVDVKKPTPHWNDTEGYGIVFKSGSEGYVISTRKDTYDTDNLSFKFTDDDGREQLVTDYAFVLKCKLNNMIVYHIPNLIMGSLQTGPTVVDIDTGKIYGYRAGVVQGQDNEHFIVYSNMKNLPDASKCKIIFQDNSTVSCCRITKHTIAECSSLLMKTADIPASIKLITVEQWMKQLNRTQVQTETKEEENRTVKPFESKMQSGRGSYQGILSKDEYNKIRDNFVFIIDHLNCDPMCVANALFEKYSFDEADMEQIEKAEKGCGGNKRAAALKKLDIALGCGYTGYGKPHEPGYQRYRDDEPGTTTHGGLFTGLQVTIARSDFLFDLFGKRSADSPRVRTMKGQAQINLQYVEERQYVKTRALDEGLRILKNHHILGIIGAAGDGKTTLSMMIANQFIADCPQYKPLLINDLEDLGYVNFEDDKYLFIIDDMFGKYNTLHARIDKWPTHFNTFRINKEKGKVVIIYVMRDYIYNTSKYQLDKYCLFVDDTEKTTQLFLHKSEFSLNNEEKKNMLYFYGISSDKIISKIIDCFGFPSIVSLCNRFSEDPHAFLLMELETFWKTNKYVYATLLLVFSLHTVSDKDLKQTSSARVASLISQITKTVWSGLNLKIAKSILIALSDSFVKCVKENNIIFSLRNFVEVAFLRHLSCKCTDMALQYCSLELLMKFVRTKHSDKWCIVINDDYYTDLSMRFLKELHNGNADIVCHPAFIDDKFLSHFLGVEGVVDVLNDAKNIDLGYIRGIQERGNFIHYITLYGDKLCLEASLLFFMKKIHELVGEKTHNGCDIMGLAAVSMHDPIYKIELLKGKKVGIKDLSALPHLAVYSDNFKVVEYINNFINFDQSKLDSQSRTVLHNACDSHHDNHEIINFLIDRGFDINAKDASGSTPLHLAVARGKKQTVSILISHGAKVDIKDDMDRLPIHIVCSSFGSRTGVDVTHILNQLIETGSVLHEADDLKLIPLLEIIANADIKCFEFLINMITIDTLNKYIQTMINEATKLQDNVKLKYILDCKMTNSTNRKLFNKYIFLMCCDSVDKIDNLHNKGMEFNEVVDENNCNILHYSCSRGSIDTVNYLGNKRGLNLDQKDKNGWTPAFYSVMSDIDPIKKLKFLSSKGASLDVVDNYNTNLLHASCLFGTIETVEYLVNEIIGLDINHENNTGITPAINCSISKVNPVKKLKFLSSKGACSDVVDNNKMSLLHASCQIGTIETIEYLVNEVNHQDITGWTPAAYCSISMINPVKKLKFLFLNGASLYTVDNDNMSLLHLSCLYGTIESVEYLVNEVRLNQKSRNNDTPLLWCFSSNIQMMEKISFLIQNGAMIIICRPYKDFFGDEDNYGKCSYPLHHSCYLGTLDTVKLLVNDAGYDVNYANYDNETALFWCLKTNIQMMEKISFLIQNGAMIIICRPYKDFFGDEDNYGKCSYPLHHSCYLGTLDTVKLLVNDAGYDVNYANYDNETALFWCLKTNIQQKEKINFLESKGAQPTK
ncbi:uncharacterized protein LOC126825710 [Patella vulgata]|uniref:uncharacterized protein LOC126825710 n=1 Tax=Patella vulgata TaxID=6465 RepID=UPI0021804D66|nr:uncharacterized protein LOC126825710 [Patella vulgata]